MGNLYGIPGRKSMTFARGPLFWRALGWLAILGPSFFLLYGWANARAAALPSVPAIVFDWERHIPFMPSFMLPYMSEDLFYALSLFVVASRLELDRHACRLLLATVFSVGCFILYPLQFSFERPEVSGFNGWLLEVLTGFDKPFNQAPSLHISLLILLWVQLEKHVAGAFLWLMRGWFVLIALSVLLVWQHHFIDVLLGAFTGFAILYMVPDQGWRRATLPGDARRYQIGGRYLALAIAGILGAWLLQGAVWWLLWPASAFALVAGAYLGLGAQVFQKDAATGKRTMAATVILAPYLVIAHASQRVFSRWSPICDLGFATLGPWPGPLPGSAAVLDLAPELAARHHHAPYSSCALMDLVSPSHAELQQAVLDLEWLLAQGMPVHIHCALGLERSAVVAAAWLLHQGSADSVDEAIAIVQQRHPKAIFRTEARRTLIEFHAIRQSHASR